MLCIFGSLASAQAQSSDRIAPQSGTDVGPIRVESKLVVVRTTVLDKKHLDKGMTQSEKRCAVSDIETFFKLAPTEPYLPKDCEALDVRDLTAADFHLFVDGREEKIQAITTEGEDTLVRDNVGFHPEFSETPAAIWGTKDRQSDQLHFTPESSPVRVYDIAFVPNDSDPAACHSIAVKVNRQHSVVRA